MGETRAHAKIFVSVLAPERGRVLFGEQVVPLRLSRSDLGGNQREESLKCVGSGLPLIESNIRKSVGGNEEESCTRRSKECHPGQWPCPWYDTCSTRSHRCPG